MSDSQLSDRFSHLATMKDTFSLILFHDIFQAAFVELVKVNKFSIGAGFYEENNTRNKQIYMFDQSIIYHEQFLKNVSFNSLI